MTNNSIEKREVRTFEVDYRCPKCNIGFLRPTGIAVGGTPIKYPHKCNNPDCDYHEIMHGLNYPYLVYEPLFSGIYMKYNNNVEYVHGKDNKETDAGSLIGSEGEMHEQPPIDNYVTKPSGK